MGTYKTLSDMQSHIDYLTRDCSYSPISSWEDESAKLQKLIDAMRPWYETLCRISKLYDEFHAIAQGESLPEREDGFDNLKETMARIDNTCDGKFKDALYLTAHKAFGFLCGFQSTAIV